MLRWAILGTGFISDTVVQAIAASAGSVVGVVAGRDPGRVEDFRQRHGIAAGVVDYHQAIADPSIDAVYIATPNHQHHPLAIAAAGAGKAVLCEKSLTTTMTSARELVDAVRDRVFFVEGLMYLAHPMYRSLVDLVTSPRVGQLRAVHARYAADIAAFVNPLGGGTIYNLGCYPASLVHLVIQSVCGPSVFAARELHAVGTRTPDGTIGSTTASVRFDNGVLATISSTDEYGMAHGFAVLTDRGELRIDTNPWLPSASDNRIVWAPYDGPDEVTEIADGQDAFFHQIALVESAVALGRTEVSRPSPRLDDSLEIMGLLTEWEAACGL